MVNVDKLLDTLRFTLDHSEHHDQLWVGTSDTEGVVSLDTFESSCGTSFCLAGFRCLLDGAVLRSVRDTRSSHSRSEDIYSRFTTEGHDIEFPLDFAAESLGLSWQERVFLFGYTGNDIIELTRRVLVLCLDADSPTVDWRESSTTHERDMAMKALFFIVSYPQLYGDKNKNDFRPVDIYDLTEKDCHGLVKLNFAGAVCILNKAVFLGDNFIINKYPVDPRYYGAQFFGVDSHEIQALIDSSPDDIKSLVNEVISAITAKVVPAFVR